MLVIAAELFDGDIGAWEQYLVDHGTARQKRDLPSVSELRRLVIREPGVLEMLRDSAAVAPN